MDGINIVQVILILVVLVNGLFAIRFVLDVLQHKEELKEEPGNPVAMAIVSFFMFFLSTFGISDFAIGSSLYPKAKWVSDKKLPGTLNTECVIPVAVMALAYISSIEVGLLTLVTAIVLPGGGCLCISSLCNKTACESNQTFCGSWTLYCGRTDLGRKIWHLSKWGRIKLFRRWLFDFVCASLHVIWSVK